MLRQIGSGFRKRRLVKLLQEAQTVEAHLLDVVAQIVELTDEGDVLHLQMRELLEHLNK